MQLCCEVESPFIFPIFLSGGERAGATHALALLEVIADVAVIIYLTAKKEHWHCILLLAGGRLILIPSPVGRAKPQELAFQTREICT